MSADMLLDVGAAHAPVVHFGFSSALCGAQSTPDESVSLSPYWPWINCPACKRKVQTGSREAAQ